MGPFGFQERVIVAVAGLAMTLGLAFACRSQPGPTRGSNTAKGWWALFGSCGVSCVTLFLITAYGLVIPPWACAIGLALSLLVASVCYHLRKRWRELWAIGIGISFAPFLAALGFLIDAANH